MKAETKQVTFTQEESALLVELLGKLQLNPLNPQAAETVAVVQSAARKIAEMTEGADGNLKS